MKIEQNKVKSETVIFRVPVEKVRQLDRLAKLIGGNRSETLRRLIPDLSVRKEKMTCTV